MEALNDELSGRPLKPMMPSIWICLLQVLTKRQAPNLKSLENISKWNVGSLALAYEQFHTQAIYLLKKVPAMHIKLNISSEENFKAYFLN